MRSISTAPNFKPKPEINGFNDAEKAHLKAGHYHWTLFVFLAEIHANHILLTLDRAFMGRKGGNSAFSGGVCVAIAAGEVFLVKCSHIAKIHRNHTLKIVWRGTG